MIDDARITELMLRYSSEFGFDTHAFARAVWSLGREAGLGEAEEACEQQITGADYHFLAVNGRWDHMAQAAVNCANAIRALRENKHDR